MRALFSKILPAGTALALSVVACSLPLNGPMPTLIPTGAAGVPLQSAATPTLAALPPVSSPVVATLDMLDARNGWALNFDSVLRTTDGGNTWLDATPPGVAKGALQPASSFFLSPTTGWVLVPSAVSDSPSTLYRTADGGATWASAAVSFGVASMQFLDASNGTAFVSLGVAAGSEAVALYRTSDGGNAWTQVFSNDPTAGGPDKGLPFGGDKNGSAFRDASHGWVGGEEPMEGYVYLFASSDGGASWKHQEVSLPSGYSNAMTMVDPPRFFDAKTGVLPVSLLGDSQSIAFYLSHDGGASWTATAPVPSAGHYSIASPADFFVWDGGASLRLSRDSGATWTTVPTNLNVKDTLISFQFVDRTNGWAITQDANSHYALYRTTDGGATWTALIP